MKKSIIIDDESISELNKLIESVRIRHLPIHSQIDYLMNDVLNNKISYENYQIKYTEVLNSCQKELRLFKYKICLVYIYNLINKEYNIDEYNAFRNLISGIYNQLENNVFDKRIIDYMIDFDIDSALKTNKFENFVITKNDQLIENSIINISIKSLNRKLNTKTNKQFVKTI